MLKILLFILMVIPAACQKQSKTIKNEPLMRSYGPSTPLPATKPKQEVSSQTKLGTYRGLIIGVDTYQDSKKWEKLSAPENDAKAIYALLTTKYGFERENTALLLGKEATLNQVKDKLKELTQKSTADDLVFVYYAGHGDYKDFDGDKTGGCWTLYDGVGAGCENKSLDLADLKEWLRRITSKHLLVATDSCFSGQLATRSSGSAQKSQSLKRYQNLLRKTSKEVLVSGDSDREVQDKDREGTHSPFARAIIRKLRDPGTPNGLVSSEDLYDSIKTNYKDEKISHYSPNLAVIPDVSGDNNGKFVFVPSHLQAAMRIVQNDTLSIDKALIDAGHFNMGAQPPTMPKPSELRSDRYVQIRLLNDKSLPQPKGVINGDKEGHFIGQIETPKDYKRVTKDLFNPDERSHQVTLTKRFYIMQKEVSNGLYKKIMGQSPATFSNCTDCPVETVSWFDAVEMANKLSQRQGLESCYRIRGNTVDWPKKQACTGWRLPTEAEWEYAAKGGKDFFFSGSNKADDVGVYGYQQAGKRTHNSCSKKKTDAGLCDMSGNVWEWVWDRYLDSYPKQQSVDPIGPANGELRALRGGGWSSVYSDLRTSMRNAAPPTTKASIVGFRLVRTFGKP